MKMLNYPIILRHRQKVERGSIDFDFPESKIILDEKGRPVVHLVRVKWQSHVEKILC